MKKSLLLLLLSAWTAGAGLAQRPPCANTVTPGGVMICLPFFDGMHETYEKEPVKEVIDRSDGAGNVILGVYLNDSTFAQSDRFGQTAIDDYFKIYMTAASVNVTAKKEMLPKVAEEFGKYLVKQKWADIRQKVEANNAGLKVGQPVLLETYYTGTTAVSYQLLIPVSQGDAALTIVCNTSQVIIRERMVWVAYYRLYKGEQTIAATKARGQAFLKKLQAAN
jgi:hypothetical protein